MLHLGRLLLQVSFLGVWTGSGPTSLQDMRSASGQHGGGSLRAAQPC